MDPAAVLGEAMQAAIGPTAAIYALAALGLNLQFGYAGLLNFGLVAFLLVGAYGPAVTVSVFGGPLWLGVIVGLMAAVLLALLLGVPTLRLRADYLAIVTIAAAEILRLIVRSNFARPVTNGVFGVHGFAGSFYDASPIPEGSYQFLGGVLSSNFVWMSIAAWVIVAAATLLVWMLMRSPWGRVLVSIREDEDAARSLGKNVFGYKMQTLILGGAFGALAGTLLALSQQAVNADSFSSTVTLFVYAVLILGGVARTWGPIVGSVLFWFLITAVDGFLRGLVGVGALPGLEAQEIGIIRFILVGLGLMVLVVVRPQGLMGSRRERMLGV